MAAARGAAVGFHGANPPGYRNWRGLAIPMLRNAKTAAEATGARLIYPGSLYVYGPDAGEAVAEDAPQHPSTRKGSIRVEMEAMLHAAAVRGLRTLVVRAGDYFGPRAPSSWVNTILLQGGKPLRKVVTPERPEVGHAWADLPDLAERVALLANRETSLPGQERLHFSGHYLRGRGIAEAVQRVVGGAVPIQPFRWLPFYLGVPFVTFLGEVIEMRYRGGSRSAWTTCGYSPGSAGSRIRRWTKRSAPVAKPCVPARLKRTGLTAATQAPVHEHKSPLRVEAVRKRDCRRVPCNDQSRSTRLAPLKIYHAAAERHVIAHCRYGMAFSHRCAGRPAGRKGCESLTMKAERATSAPSSCVSDREVWGEALTGEAMGPSIEPRNKTSPGCQRFLRSGRQHGGVRYHQCPTGPVWSETLARRRHLLHGNREISWLADQEGSVRIGKAGEPKPHDPVGEEVAAEDHDVVVDLGVAQEGADGFRGDIAEQQAAVAFHRRRKPGDQRVRQATMRSLRPCSQIRIPARRRESFVCAGAQATPSGRCPARRPILGACLDTRFIALNSDADPAAHPSRPEKIRAEGEGV